MVKIGGIKIEVIKIEVIKIDVKKINTLYNCRGYPQTTGSGKPKPTKPKPTTGEIINPDLTCTDSNE